jgi:hypothetical protein
MTKLYHKASIALESISRCCCRTFNHFIADIAPCLLLTIHSKLSSPTELNIKRINPVEFKSKSAEIQSTKTNKTHTQIVLINQFKDKVYICIYVNI